MGKTTVLAGGARWVVALPIIFMQSGSLHCSNGRLTWSVMRIDSVILFCTKSIICGVVALMITDEND